MVIPAFMPMKLIKKYSIWLILLIALIIRGYKIDVLPALNPDEAALGYNAYSLLLTGKDEHGVSWPLHFQSFGDFKPGGYVYITIPFIKFLGLNPLAIRFPNLILSVLTILIIYKLVLLLTYNFQLSTLVALVLTFSPWHIHFSRGAWESSAALFFIVLGVYWFYSYIISHKSFFAFLFPLAFVASLYIYHSARLISPLLVLFLIISSYSQLLKNYKKLILPLLIAILLTIPVLVSFLQSGGATRLGGVGLTADYGPTARAEELLNQHGNTQLINRITHNKRVLYVISWAEKYFSHFDCNFLFVTGDDVPRSKSPDMGQLYLIELPFLLLGVVYLLKQAKTYSLKYFTFIFLIIAPIASSLTFQAPSALRALAMVIPFSILIGCGLNYSLNLCQKSLFRITFYGFLIISYTFSVGYYFDAYFVQLSPVLPDQNLIPEGFLISPLALSC